MGISFLREPGPSALPISQIAGLIHKIVFSCALPGKEIRINPQVIGNVEKRPCMRGTAVVEIVWFCSCLDMGGS